jgi:hypothetical protein
MEVGRHMQEGSSELVSSYHQVQKEELSDPQLAVLPQQLGGCSKEYLNIAMLRRMSQSSGSSLLAAVLAALPGPLVLWTPGDDGVDEVGIYELREPDDQWTGVGSL